MAGQLDTTIPAQIGSRDNICVLTRPPGWGRLHGDRGFDSTIDTLQARRDVLLCNPRGDAYIDIRRDASAGGLIDLADYSTPLVMEFQTAPPTLFDSGEDNTGNTQRIRATFVNTQELPPIDGYDAHEWTVDLKRGGQSWRWLIRGYRKPPPAGAAGVIYVLRAYARRRDFAALEPTLRGALDSVRFPP